MALVIAGFPGIGKSYYFKHNTKYTCLDSDSTAYSWVETKQGKTRNPLFPANYIEHIQKNLDTTDIIFVSIHPIVLKALAACNIKFYVAYPEPSETIKQEYLARYKLRGSSEQFIASLEVNFFKYINDCIQSPTPFKVILKQGETISDKIEELLRHS